jgi:CBS domain-containing protein
MRVEELMSKQVYSCRAEDTLDKAAQIMWDRDVGAIPVCAENGRTRVVGMITDRDIAMCAFLKGRPLHEISISEGMTRDVCLIRPSDAASSAEQEMRSSQVRRLPVVDESGGLVGIISLADLGRAASRESSSTGRDVSSGEVGHTLAAIVEPTHRRPSHRSVPASSSQGAAAQPSL